MLIACWLYVCCLFLVVNIVGLLTFSFVLERQLKYLVDFVVDAAFAAAVVAVARACAVATSRASCNL